MKKFLILITSSVLLLTSCIFYNPVKDYSKILNKNEYKDISSLKEPFVLNLSTKLDFTSLDKNTITRTRGSYYFIYDWESESIFDFVYVPTDDYSQDYLCPYKDDEDHYYYFSFNLFNDSNPKIFALESDKNTVTNYPLDNITDFKNMNIQFQDIIYNNNIILWNNDLKTFYSLDIDTKSINNSLKFEEEYIASYIFDGKDTIWYKILRNDIDTHKEYISLGYYNLASEDVNTNFMQKDCSGDPEYYDNYFGWLLIDEYDLLYANSDYLILKKVKKDLRDKNNPKIEQSTTVINLSNKEEKNFALVDNSTYNIIEIKELNDTLYAMIEMDNSYKIAKLDIENLSADIIGETNNSYYCKSEIRNDRIYFLPPLNTSSPIFTIKYFDTSNNEFHVLEEIDINNYLKAWEEKL